MMALLLALKFMTRLPLPAAPATEDSFASAIRWFPMAGLVVGAAVAAACGIGTVRDPALGALLGLAAWVGVTGALHFDGLGDIADAAGAAHADRSRLGTVLRDPHIGSFGAAAIALQLLAKCVLLTLTLERASPLLLVLVPTLARIGPIAWALVLPPLHEGTGTMFRKGASWTVLACWLTLWCAAAFLFAPLLLAALLILPLWALWLRARIGGISGDGHGAGIELTETVALLMLAIVR